MTFFDAHCDTITKAHDTSQNLFENNLKIDIKRLLSYNWPVQVFSIWTAPKYYTEPLSYAFNVINYYYEQLKTYSQYISKVFCYEDIIKNKMDGKISSILSLEGGECIDGDVSNLKIMNHLGIKMMSLTWNHGNCMASGINDEVDFGLTEIGREIIHTMQEIGMIVDVSHLSVKGFWEVDSIMNNSYVATHSNAQNVAGSKRNLSNDQIKAIANKGGAIGINLYPVFLTDGRFADIAHILKHIDYIINIGGTDCIGIGCDYDGIEKTPTGFHDISCLEQLIFEVEKRYGSDTADKFSYGNFTRVFKNICG